MITIDILDQIQDEIRMGLVELPEEFEATKQGDFFFVKRKGQKIAMKVPAAALPHMVRILSS